MKETSRSPAIRVHVLVKVLSMALMATAARAAAVPEAGDGPTGSWGQRLAQIDLPGEDAGSAARKENLASRPPPALSRAVDDALLGRGGGLAKLISYLQDGRFAPDIVADRATSIIDLFEARRDAVGPGLFQIAVESIAAAASDTLGMRPVRTFRIAPDLSVPAGGLAWYFEPEDATLFPTFSLARPGGEEPLVPIVVASRDEPGARRVRLALQTGLYRVFLVVSAPADRATHPDAFEGDVLIDDVATRIAAIAGMEPEILLGKVPSLAAAGGTEAGIVGTAAPASMRLVTLETAVGNPGVEFEIVPRGAVPLAMRALVIEPVSASASIVADDADREALFGERRGTLAAEAEIAQRFAEALASFITAAGPALEPQETAFGPATQLSPN